MAKKLNSVSSLTEFAPLSPETKDESFSIRKMFWRSKGKHAPKDLDRPANTRLNEETLSETSSCAEENYDVVNTQIGKSVGMSGLLNKIIHNIVDKKKKGLQSYKDSDFKQYWMPDSNCKECYECGDKFTTFRRRHHCRVCGQIFCRHCCSQEIHGELIGYTEDLRVCNYCYRTVHDCVKSLDQNNFSVSEASSFHASLPLGLNLDENTGPFSDSKVPPASALRRKSSVMGFREEDIARAKNLKPNHTSLTSPGQISNRSDGNTQDKTELKSLLSELLSSVQSVPLWKQDYKDHHTKLVLGSDIVDWLISHNPCLLRLDAVNIGQAFLDSELIECIIPQQSKFIDGNILYRPLEALFCSPSSPKENSMNEIQESMEPLWVKEIAPSDSYLFKEQSSPTQSEVPMFRGSLSRLSSSSSMFYLDLDVKESRVSVFRAANKESSASEGASSPNQEKTQVSQTSDHSQIKCGTLNDSFKKVLNNAGLDNSLMKSIVSSQKWQNSQLIEDNGEKAAFENLNLAYKHHEEALLNQLLSSESLPLSWAEVVLPIIYHVVNAVHPDVKNGADDMDVRQYVQFKKIPGGNKSESSIVNGVVFTKTVAHKKMKQVIQNPTILLLSSPVSYQRVENKISSLDPILMQEFEYLKNAIGKLTVFKPDILLVEKTVSRLAQEMLLNLGITVVLNVKSSVMERLARSTQAAIVSTIDSHLGRPQLGSCDQFYVKSFFQNAGKSKTLMFFDGCPENLGCTILLRGGSSSELKKVKHVVQFMIYAAYNWRLERSFLMDELAFLPSASFKGLAFQSSQESAFFDEYLDSEACIQKKGPSRVDDSSRKLEAQCVSDFSDPLHSYLNDQNEVIVPESSIEVNMPPATDSFKKLLEDIVLCCSIGIKVPLPFLETEAGKKCSLRKYLPQEVYWSRHFQPYSEKKTFSGIDADLDEKKPPFKKFPIHSGNVEELKPHRFVSMKIVDFLKSSMEMQSLLSDFRARGGTIRYLCPHKRTVKEKEKKSSDEVDNHLVGNTGLCWEKKLDALDSVNHQSISVLFSSHSYTSENAPNYCVSPWVVKMEFYGSNDITLGGFLERYCFRSSYICPSASCASPMTEHIRKFVHNSGCVHILLYELESPLQPAENNIVMWSWCQKCSKVTPVVFMSQDTWSFSFAKYLELRFYAVDYRTRGASEQCSHSLHHDFYQYFAQNRSVAIFKYTPICIWDVAFPTFVIAVNSRALSVATLVENIKYIATKGHEIYSEILNLLFGLRTEYAGLGLEDFIDDLINILKLEIPPFRVKIEEIQLSLTSTTVESLNSNSNEDVDLDKDVCNFMWKIEDQVILLKYHIAEVVQTWNGRIQEFILACKKEQKMQARQGNLIPRTSEDETSLKTNDSSYDGKEPIPILPIADDCKEISQTAGKSLIKKCWYSLSHESVFLPVSSSTHDVRKCSSEETIPPGRANLKTSKFTFNKKISVFSSDSSYVYGVTPGIYAGLRVPEMDDDESYIICHRGNKKCKVKKACERIKSDQGVNENQKSLVTKFSSEKKTVKGLISQFLSSSSNTSLENPFPPSEHLLLPQSSKIPVIVHEEEPSSIIAYTIASHEYEQKLQELKQNLNLSQKDSQTSSPLLKHRRLNSDSHADSGIFFSEDACDFSSDANLKPPNKASNFHVEVQFTDNSTRFYCRVYYAEQFRKLRNVIFSEGEERYIRSLSHCVQWIARGGKSGSMFCKTHDDRFILKQMPRLELQSFMDLAPSYIHYLNKSFIEQKPTLLAKILGIYRIGFKNTLTNVAMKMDLLVMENLFYDRNISKKYDLKGSIRNRLVNTSGVQEEDLVLLDENLLKITCDNPLYIRPHSKTVLSLAINNDTQFLADQSVMDYSLLVGLDAEKNELVVGIIDYIRTFTWDKKVEMIIKSSGLLGGHGKLPTVVSPELYRIRFCEAMDNYFLWIPDKWTGLGKSVEE